MSEFILINTSLCAECESSRQQQIEIESAVPEKTEPSLYLKHRVTILDGQARPQVG